MKLLNKYGGLVFDDIDVTPPVRMRVSATKLKYIRRSGWHVMGEPPEYVGDGTDEDLLEPFAITKDVLIELLKKTEQPEILNVRVLHSANNNDDDDDDDEGNDDDSSIDSDE